jgi:hypothetical protein
MQYPADPQTPSTPHTASEPHLQPCASSIVGSPHTYPSSQVQAPSLHNLGAHPFTSASVRASLQTRSSAHSKSSLLQLAALQPC